MNVQWAQLAPVGAGTLVTIAVLMIFTGRLVPRSTYSEMVKDRDLWRTLYLESRRQVNDLLVPTAKAATKAFETVDHLAGQADAADGAGGSG